MTTQEIREIIEILLTGEGFAVDQAGDGTQALAMLKEKHYDLIILDIMMPGMNGYQTCLEIRKLTNAPILFLSARTKDSDKTLGFSSGGDDYLAKPFSYPELISRVKALIRRYQVYKGKDEETITEVPSHIHYHNLDIDRDTETVYRDGEAVDLTSTEYAMLLTLVTHPVRSFLPSGCSKSSGMSRITMVPAILSWYTSEICAVKLKSILLLRP